MTHRSDAEATIIVTRDTLAQTEGKSVPTDVSIANSARAQAIATASVAQAILALVDALTTEEPQR